jgi:hypothetical protein
MPAARARRAATDVEDVPSRTRPRSDVYVGLLLLALLAQLAGVLFLFLDYNTYPDKAPTKVADRPPPLVTPSGGAGAPGVGAPGAGAQGVPPGAGAQGVPPAGGRGVPPPAGGGAQGGRPGPAVQ